MANRLLDIHGTVLRRALSRSDLDFVLSEVHRATFRWHPLGFMHARLFSEGEKILRFHMWPLEMRRPQNPPWFIHNHNFDFESYIVRGSIRNDTFKVTVDKDGDSTLYRVQYEGALSAIERTGDAVHIRASESQTMTQGNYYDEAAPQFHRTHVALNETAATLVAAKTVSTTMPYVVGAKAGREKYVFERSVCAIAEIQHAFVGLDL